MDGEAAPTAPDGSGPAGASDGASRGGVWTDEAMWQAFAARDRAADGQFVVGVRTTGIYCRPSCPARRPLRAHVAFFADPDAAEAAGLRPCRRCRPEGVRRDRAAVAQAAALIARAAGLGERVALADLAAAVGYAPHHFQRVFARAVGISPAAYGRHLRARRWEEVLDGNRGKADGGGAEKPGRTRRGSGTGGGNGEGAGRVTDMIYEAGYGGASGAYAEAHGRLGMTPATRRDGGAGEDIRFAVVPSSLGALLVAATDKGVCRIAFDEDEAALRARFPQARLLPPDAAFADLAAQVVAAVDDPARGADLPLDVRGTAFRQAVWAALRAIPPGETRSYADLAAAAGRPRAVRAAGTACGANELAVLIPCHRAVRSDGGLGGYAYGLDRKRALLARESAAGDADGEG